MTRRASFSTTSCGGVAAAVPPDVHDQALAGHLDAQVAVELRPAGADHVGDVQVAEPAAASLADVGRARLGHPVLVAQRPLVGERHDHDRVPRVAARRPGRRSARPACRAVPDQQRARAAPAGRPAGRPRRRSRRPARTATPGAASGERARGSEDSPGRTRSTRQHAVLVAGEVGAEQARRGAASPVVRRAGVTYACEVPSSPCTSHSRSTKSSGVAIRSSSGPVAVEHAVPVDAAHVRRPEVVAHEPAGLVVAPAATRRPGRRCAGPGDRSTVTVSSSSSSRTCGRRAPTRSSPSSLTTSRVPSPLTANQSSVVGELARRALARS